MDPPEIVRHSTKRILAIANPTVRFFSMEQRLKRSSSGRVVPRVPFLPVLVVGLGIMLSVPAVLFATDSTYGQVELVDDGIVSFSLDSLGLVFLDVDSEIGINDTAVVSLTLIPPNPAVFPEALDENRSMVLTATMEGFEYEVIGGASNGAQWEWIVKPKSTGTHALVGTITATPAEGEIDEATTYGPFVVATKVSESTPQKTSRWLRAYGWPLAQSAVSTLFGFLLGLVAVRLNARRKSATVGRHN